jgi:hypothetical protein
MSKPPTDLIPRLEEIPEFVLAPRFSHQINGIEKSREGRTIRVYGHGTYKKCLNCGHLGERDALLFKPDEWPNFAIICGSGGCGIYWGMVGVPPDDVVWIYRDVA